jgi:hypothetical protein
VKQPASRNETLMTELWRCNYCIKSRDSSVGIALGYGPDDRGSRFRFSARPGNFSLHRHVQNGSAPPPQPPIKWVRRALSPGVKRPGRKADHSPPSIAFMACAQLIKHRDKFISNFTFTFKNTSDVQEVQ